MQIDKLKTECLCNLDWLHTKLRATSLQQVILDFSLLEDREADLVADALRMSGSALKIDPDAIGPEISGRLLPHIHRCLFLFYTSFHRNESLIHVVT